MTVDAAWTAKAVDDTISEDDARAIRRCILDYFEWRWATGDGPRA